MTFPILGGNGAVAGYSIDNSLRFNENDNPNLSRTPSASNRKTFTTSFWFKRSHLDSTAGSNFYLYSGGSDANNYFGFLLNSSTDKAVIFDSVGGSNKYDLRPNRVFRDTSAWYHIVLIVDSTESTSSDRVKLYINGVKETSFSTETYPSLNQDFTQNSNVLHTIGAEYSGSLTSWYDGYITEYNFIDGQAKAHTDFGEFDEDSGIWKPIEYTGTYGTNGFYLDFENSGSLGADQSGNSNNFTTTNLASTDQTTDTPTNNFATLNSLTPVVTHTLSEANLKSTNSSGTHGGTTATISYPTSGKWYHEVRINAEDSSKGQGVAIGNQIYRSSTDWGNYTNLIGYFSDGTKQTDAGYSSYGVVHNAGDIIGVAYNADDQELTFYHDNSSQGTITTSEMDGTIDFNNLCPIVFGRNMGQTFNFGQDSSFAGAETRQNNSDGNGYGDFYYAPPSGYLALCTQNLATELSPTIDDGSAHFHTQLYTGNSTARTITNDANAGDFKPDLVWVKARNHPTGHSNNLVDSSRGGTKTIYTNTTDREETITQGITGFATDGFTLGIGAAVNENYNYVAWQWKANGGTTASNTDGSITSTVQANTTAGFSIVTYTGSGVNGATVGHGLGKVPDIVLTKNRSNSGYNWLMYHSANTSAPETDALFLNLTNATSDSEFWWNDTAPTSSVFSLSLNGGNNDNGNTYVAYCFNNVEGYSKFGSYTGNGSSDGTFVYTGFRPAWVMTKGSSTAQAWSMRDNKRDSFNSAQKAIYANATDAESDNANNSIDLLSNGFKIRNQFGTENQSGQTYIYMCFASNPFVSSTSIPVTAR